MIPDIAVLTANDGVAGSVANPVRSGRSDHGEYHGQFGVRRFVQVEGLQKREQRRDRCLGAQLAQRPPCVDRRPRLRRICISRVESRIAGQPDQFADVAVIEAEFHRVIGPSGRRFAGFPNGQQLPGRGGVVAMLVIAYRSSHPPLSLFTWPLGQAPEPAESPCWIMPLTGRGNNPCLYRGQGNRVSVGEGGFYPRVLTGFSPFTHDCAWIGARSRGWPG
jgi:hypothetical protein